MADDLDSHWDDVELFTDHFTDAVEHRPILRTHLLGIGKIMGNDDARQCRGQDPPATGFAARDGIQNGHAMVHCRVRAGGGSTGGLGLVEKHGELIGA